MPPGFSPCMGPERRSDTRLLDWGAGVTSPCCPGGASGGFHSYSPEVPPAVMPGGPWAAPPDCSGSVPVVSLQRAPTLEEWAGPLPCRSPPPLPPSAALGLRSPAGVGAGGVRSDGKSEVRAGSPHRWGHRRRRMAPLLTQPSGLVPGQLPGQLSVSQSRGEGGSRG